MSYLMQEPVRSRLIRSFSDPNTNPGLTCTFQIPGICLHRPDTLVWMHLQIEGQGGMATKCSDLTGAIGCMACHDLIDRRDKRWESNEHSVYREFFMRRATDRSLHLLWQAGVLIIKGGGRDKLDKKGQGI